MHWGVEGSILFSVAIVLRRLLHLDSPSPSRFGLLMRLDRARESIYQPACLELGTASAIVGVSLNDAIEERNAGGREIAWRMLELTAQEWEQLGTKVNGLLDIMSNHLPVAQAPLPVRNILAHRFKSAGMMEYLRMHELLDQFVFHSRLRFQLRLRMLRRSVAALTAELRRSLAEAERKGMVTHRVWRDADLGYHDLDLVAKEALLALRAFIVRLNDEDLEAFAADIQKLLHHSVRTPAL